MTDPITKYLAYTGGVKRYSSRTQAVYREILDQFARFVEPEEIVASLNTSVLRSYEVWLMDDQGVGARTVGLHLSVLSGFCRWLVAQGALASNPVRTLPRPKVEKRLPVFYREENMDEYFEQTALYGSEEVLRLFSGKPGDKGDVQLYSRVLNRIIISLLYSTGIRRAELISLNRGSYDSSRKVMHVRGKGDKMREIPLTQTICEEILLYLRAIDKMGIEVGGADSPLLVTRAGSRLYPVFVDRAVKEELGAVPEITSRKSPHVLRHTLATELLDDGTDINSIKELLGHSSLAATQVYTHNSIEKLKKVYDSAHPRAAKK
ncbi:MAG: tyrosine-type recombinase/integrase [Bacteroidales bacterium]|nr:tyrosine-type recombinase/integrase [Bacteroidales bacterium]